MKKSSTLLLLFYFVNQHATGQPAATPVYAFPDVFTYFNPSSPAIPPGAAQAAKGMILYEDQIIRPDSTGTTGTAFLIRTFRNDNLVCMCLSGHQVFQLHNQSGIIPGTGDLVAFNSDIYMNYTGKNEQINGKNYNKINYLQKGYLDRASIAAYQYNPDDDDAPEYALLLVDKRKLPSASFTMLPYDFTADPSAFTGKAYYSLHYSHQYPLLISTGGTTTQPADHNLAVLQWNLPYASGSGGSGAPLILRPGNGSPWLVRGLLSTATFQQADFRIDSGGDTLRYSKLAEFTKLSLLESAIRKHCWNKRDSSTISGQELFKQPSEVDNSGSTDYYSQNRSFTSRSDMASSASGFTETIQGEETLVKTSYLKANHCSLGGFSLPAVYPGSLDAWQVVVTANEILVHSNFNYTASGHSELNLASVVIDESSSSSAWVTAAEPAQATGSPTTADAASPAGFSVFPNPGTGGIFYVSVPGTVEKYRLKVFCADGRQVCDAENIGGGSPYRLNLSALPGGAYMLVLYRQKTGNKCFSKTILIY